MKAPLRSLVLWAILIVLFFAFYNYFSQPGSAAPSSEAVGVFAEWAPALIVLVLIGGGVFLVRRARRTLRINQDGIDLLNRGRLLEAAETFDRAATQSGQGAVLASFNAGVARLRLWQLERALTAFENAEKRAKDVKPLKLPIPGQRALAQALLGHVADAERTLGAAGADLDSSGYLTRAVLAARAADFPRAFELADRLEVKQLGGNLRGLAEALRAWARQQTTGERWPVDRIALFGEAGPALLQAAWPELVAFVEQAPN